MVHVFLSDLFQYVDSILKETTNALTENSMIKEIIKNKRNRE